MSHPFSMQLVEKIEQVSEEQTSSVNGGVVQCPVPAPLPPLKYQEPIYTIFEFGEGGGCFPEAEVM